MGRPRIAILTPTFPPYRGGIGKVAESDAKQIAELGIDVHVFTPTVGASAGPCVAHELRPSLRIGNAALAPGAFAIPFGYDAVVLHYPFFGSAEPAALATLLGAKAKIILVYHMDVVGSGALGAFFRIHGATLRPLVLSRAWRIIVTSYDYAATSAIGKRFAASQERFREMPPAVDTARFAPGPKSPELLARYGLSATDRIITFVGGLDRAHYFKGVGNLLSALSVKELRDCKAVIVGGGDLLEGYRAQAASLGITDRVVFAGPVSDEELPAHYRLGDVFAFPSIDRSEAFGIAALESLSCGVPVVASDLVGVRTIVRDGVTGMRVFPGSASALAATTARLLADEGLRKKLGEGGRRMAVAEYGETARQGRWKDLIAELEHDR